MTLVEICLFCNVKTADKCNFMYNLIWNWNIGTDMNVFDRSRNNKFFEASVFKKGLSKKEICYKFVIKSSQFYASL